MGSDYLTEPYAAAQEVIVARVDELLAACARKDFDRVAACHLSGPKFSKFDDVPPFDRQDAQRALRSEMEQLSAVEHFEGHMDDCKIDVFGPVAVVTGILRGTYRISDDIESFCSRSTLVFVDCQGEWLIAHEHHSALPPGQ